MLFEKPCNFYYSHAHLFTIMFLVDFWSDITRDPITIKVLLWEFSLKLASYWWADEVFLTGSSASVTLKGGAKRTKLGMKGLKHFKVYEKSDILRYSMVIRVLYWLNVIQFWSYLIEYFDLYIQSVSADLILCLQRGYNCIIELRNEFANIVNVCLSWLGEHRSFILAFIGYPFPFLLQLSLLWSVWKF